MTVREYLRDLRPGDRVTVQSLDDLSGKPFTLATGEAWEEELFEGCLDKRVLCSEYNIKYGEYVVTLN